MATMLQQILNDMYIDPELLAELDEEQKQILFCKMREEQVRKWKLRDEQTKEEDYCRRKKEGGKKVSFLMGGDGEPLVVVLGGDEDVDAILQERAKRQAEMEEEAIRKAAEEELDKLVRLSQSTVEAMERKVSSPQPSQNNNQIKDPTREAVVRSLQEATREMEEEMRALEVEEKEGLSQNRSMASVFRNAATTALGNSKPLKDNVNASRKSSYTNGSSHAPPCNGTTSMREKNEDYNNRCYSSAKPQISISPYAFERSPVIPFGVAAQIEQFERLSESSLEALKTATLERAKNRRQKEILDNLRNQIEAAKNEANKSMEGTVIVAAEKEEVAWREQEKKAKEAERRIREIARRAREEHRRTSADTNGFGMTQIIDPNSESSSVLNGDINGNIKSAIHDDFRSNSEHILEGRNNTNIGKGKTRSRSYRPPNREAVISWFKGEELPKLVGINARKDVIEPWFHGIISRADAERTLEKAETGSFLVRVSERIWGYAVSYKAPDRCRHYLIDAIGGKYAFLGSHRNTHLSLGKLIEYHKKEYITSSGREILDKPCGQLDPSKPDYLELFEGTNYVII